MVDCPGHKTKSAEISHSENTSGSVLGNRFSKHLSVYYVLVAFTEVITTNSEVGAITPAALKGLMTRSKSWN